MTVQAGGIDQGAKCGQQQPRNMPDPPCALSHYQCWLDVRCCAAVQQEELRLARLFRPPLYLLTLSLGHAGSSQTSGLSLSPLSNLCLCLSVDGFLQAEPCLTWMPRHLHHHHLYHHLPQLSRRAISSWRSELDTQCFLPNGCGETVAQPACGDHAVILQSPRFTLKE